MQLYSSKTLSDSLGYMKCIINYHIAHIAKSMKQVHNLPSAVHSHYHRASLRTLGHLNMHQFFEKFCNLLHKIWSVV